MSRQSPNLQSLLMKLGPPGRATDTTIADVTAAQKSMKYSATTKSKLAEYSGADRTTSAAGTAVANSADEAQLSRESTVP